MTELERLEKLANSRGDRLNALDREMAKLNERIKTLENLYITLKDYQDDTIRDIQELNELIYRIKL